MACGAAVIAKSKVLPWTSVAGCPWAGKESGRAAHEAGCALSHLTARFKDEQRVFTNVLMIKEGLPKRRTKRATSNHASLLASQNASLDFAARNDVRNDILRYWFHLEPETRVAPDYMRIQTDINDKMRAILVDW